MTQTLIDVDASEPTYSVLEQAAEWYARMRDGKVTGEDRLAWQEWLHAAEEHTIAWRYVEEISRSFEPLRSMPDSPLTATTLHAASNRLQARRRTLVSLALLGSGSLLGWLSWRAALLPAGLMAMAADYRTAIGEQREVVLDDGTRLWLNTDSAINVDFTDQMRRVTLLDGEVFIETAHEARRPFMVDTSHGSMRALGTRFNVRLDRGETRLAVYEGAVEIRTLSSGETSVISAGRQADFKIDRIHAQQSADMAREAWTQGTLIADNITLREVVRELCRYRKGYLGIADDVADLTVYGNFPIRDTDRVLAMLATALPIRIRQRYAWWTTIEARVE